MQPEQHLLVSRGGGAQRLGLAQQGVHLPLNDLTERRSVVLRGHAGGDEERHDVDAGWRMQDEVREQSGLSRPRRGHPTPVAGASTVRRDIVHAEGRQLGKLALTPLEAGDKALAHLQEIAGDGGALRNYLYGTVNHHAAVGEGPSSLGGRSA
ncbi:hypothetical protein [Streptomyces sp. NPDC017095]|uniref:hypothetical protein n=1 Tax=Streptomyces sp. NPDC017095 TaxID=3364977 RepID=UPI00378CA63A